MLLLRSPFLGPFQKLYASDFTVHHSTGPVDSTRAPPMDSATKEASKERVAKAGELLGTFRIMSGGCVFDPKLTSMG